MKVRVKCPSCGLVQDILQDSPCTKCQTVIPAGGEAAVQIYRMGSPIGVAVGFGIYIDGEPMGHVANTESVFVPVKAGTHNLHMTAGMCRKCQDLSITVAPGQVAYVKAKIKAGFISNKIVLMPSSEEEMPK